VCASVGCAFAQDDEKIFIQLARVHPAVAHIYIVINSYSGQVPPRDHCRATRRAGPHRTAPQPTPAERAITRTLTLSLTRALTLTATLTATLTLRMPLRSLTM
jgi:hypothetical protein